MGVVLSGNIQKIKNINKMKFSIEWLEATKTSTGKDKYNVTLKDETGKTTESVTIWGDYPNYAELKPGSTVEGTLTEKPYNGKIYYTLYAPKAEAPRRSPSAINQAMKKKEESIEKFQVSKAEGIKISSTLNHAADIAVARLGEGKTKEEYESEILYWRSWLWKHWDDEQEPF
jgi:hypothetical protein